eukprot:10660884-Karenia_brevis.AAC.1
MLRDMQDRFLDNMRNMFQQQQQQQPRPALTNVEETLKDDMREEVKQALEDEMREEVKQALEDEMREE